MSEQKNNTFQPETIDFDMKTLSFIIAIVDEGGLSNAAEKLYLSQPALSRYLRHIEIAIGTPLFHRSHKGLTLTSAGKVFINGARSMLHIEQEALQQIQAVRQDRNTTLTVAVQNLFSYFLSEQVTPIFQKQFPHITVQIKETDSNQVKQMVSNGTVDLGLFIGDPSETPYFSQECLFHSQLVFCAAPNSPGLLRSQNEGFHLNFFADEPMMMSLEHTFLSRKQNLICTKNGIPSPHIVVRGQIPILTELIRNGYGNVILPIEAMEFPNDRLFYFEPEERYSCITAWCHGRPLSQAASEYLETMKEAVNKNKKA